MLAALCIRHQLTVSCTRRPSGTLYQRREADGKAAAAMAVSGEDASPLKHNTLSKPCRTHIAPHTHSTQHKHTKQTVTGPSLPYRSTATFTRFGARPVPFEDPNESHSAQHTHSKEDTQAGIRPVTRPPHERGACGGVFH